MKAIIPTTVKRLLRRNTAALTAAVAALCATAAEYDATRYGAKPDGATDNTAAIQKAIDDCAAKGGGRVIVPAGGKYVTYTLNLKSNVELHVERGATLLGGEDSLKYPVFETNAVWNAERSPRFNRRAMFYTVGQTNVAITGAGTIDGNAEKFHHEEKHNNYTGYRWFRNSHTNITGRCVFFVGCRDVRLDDVLILHPAGWSTWFLDCDRVGVRGVRIEADRRFPNGDGLHFGGCRDVTVADCIVHSQDDALILRTHQEQMKKPRPCERVVVNNCILNSYRAFAIRIGWTGDGPVRDITVNNIVSTISGAGVGFTLPPEPPAPREYMDPPRGRGLDPPPLSERLPFYAENIHFSNMTIFGSRTPFEISIGGNQRVDYIRNISFSHCRFKSPNLPRVSFHERNNVRDWRFSDVVFEIDEGAKKTAQEVFKDIKNAEFDNVKIVYAPEQVFWNMEVEVEGEKAPLAVESVKQKCRTEGGKLVYGPLTCDGKTFDMKVVVNVRDTPSGKAYSGVVENNDKRVRVTTFNGPKLDAVALDPAKAHIYIPDGFGRRLNNFPTDGRISAPWEAKSRAFMYMETGPYPSRHLTMPWVAIDTGSGTWYAAVHDARERAKRIGVRWYFREKRADVRFRHPVSIRAGDRWELPETVFEKVPGDWHAAAKRYRAWFDSAHPAVRSAAPDWTRDLTGWLLVIMKQQNEELMWPYTDIPKLCDVAERNGLNSIGLFGWTVGGHDHLYPDYDADPKMGGAAALKAGIAEAHRRGIRVCIYANGQLQQIGATKFWGEHGEKIAIRKRDGSPYIQTFHKYNDIPVYKFAIGCLHAEPWHDRMLALARQARGFGADAILYDQLGVTTPFECWGKGHGHPVPWHSHCEERPGFVRRIVDEMHVTDKDFAVFTEGLHDGILDSIGMFHASQPSSFMWDVNALKESRASRRANAEPFPELFRYTFPELVTTTRNPTPMTLRSFVNYAAVFGLRHEIEIRYMPDRAYALDGKVPTKKDYGEVKDLPSLQAMHAEQPAVASAYMKAVGDFQRTHAKYLLRGTFVDDEGLAPVQSSLVAKRFVADDGTSAVCVWNVTNKPVPVEITGLGKPKGVFAPAGEGTTGPLAADSIRVYVFGDVKFENVTVVPASPDARKPFVFDDCTDCAAPYAAPAATPTDEMSILLFGHSFGVDSTEHLPALLDAAGIRTVRIGRFVKANCSLEEHYNFFTADAPNPKYTYYECAPGSTSWQTRGLTVKQVVSERAWDYVVFQNSLENEGRYETAQPYLNNLVAYVRTRSQELFAREPVICWNLFWPISKLAENGSSSVLKYRLSFYGNSSTNAWEAYKRATRELMADTGITNVVPTGAAIMNLRASALNTTAMKEFTRDKYHLSEGAGRYAAACTFFEYFIKPKYGVSVLGNSLRLPSLSQPVTDDNAAIIQQYAVDAVMSGRYVVCTVNNAD